MIRGEIDRNKWKKQCREHWEKALDNRSHHFKISEKKELVQKNMLKDAKERYQAQVSKKIDAEELCSLMTTFKPSDYPFSPCTIEDEPMTLKSNLLKKYPEKLPTFLMQVSDEYSFQLALKIMFSIIKFLPSSYNKHSEYLKGFISLFGLTCKNPDDVSCYEFSDSDRDILIGILAPHILNKQDEDEESDNSVGGMKEQIGRAHV